MTAPESAIKDIESELTIVGGRVVYASNRYPELHKATPLAQPDWSPVRVFAGAHENIDASATIVE
jgi:hypothetical protein